MSFAWDRRVDLSWCGCLTWAFELRLRTDPCVHCTRMKGNQPHCKIIRNPLLQKLLLIIIFEVICYNHLPLL